MAINGFTPAVLSILEPRYLLRNCLHKVLNSFSLLARQDFSSFRLKPYLSLFIRYLKVHANEADFKKTMTSAKIRLLGTSADKMY